MTRKTLTLKNPPKVNIPQETALERQQKCLNFLCETFPKCFSKKEPKPLKTNIFHEIIDRLGDSLPYSKSILRQTLKIYCHTFKYLNNTLEFNFRTGLDGEKADNITQAHREYVKEQLMKSKKKQTFQKF